MVQDSDDAGQFILADQACLVLQRLSMPSQSLFADFCGRPQQLAAQTIVWKIQTDQEGIHSMAWQAMDNPEHSQSSSSGARGVASDAVAVPAFSRAMSHMSVESRASSASTLLEAPPPAMPASQACDQFQICAAQAQAPQRPTFPFAVDKRHPSVSDLVSLQSCSAQDLAKLQQHQLIAMVRSASQVLSRKVSQCEQLTFVNRQMKRKCEQQQKDLDLLKDLAGTEKVSQALRKLMKKRKSTLELEVWPFHGTFDPSQPDRPWNQT